MATLKINRVSLTIEATGKTASFGFSSFGHGRLLPFLKVTGEQHKYLKIQISILILFNCIIISKINPCLVT